MISQELEYHPIANLFPMASEFDYQSLKQSIETSGQQHPIVLFEDKILDGRNRYKACGELDIKPVFVYFQGSYDEAITYSIALNASRRHLSQSQKAIIAARAVLKSRNEKYKISVAKAKKLFGVGENYIKRAISICQHNPDSAQHIFQNGNISISRIEVESYRKNKNSIIQKQIDKGYHMSPTSDGLTIEQMERYRYLQELKREDIVLMLMEAEGTLSPAGRYVY